MERPEKRSRVARLDGRAAPIPASVFRNGQVLQTLASEHVANLSRSGYEVPSIPKQIYGSVCSGSALGELVMGALSAELNADLELAWVCEIEASKRDWCMKIVLGNYCCFGDVAKLSSSKAWCHRHSKDGVGLKNPNAADNPC